MTPFFNIGSIIKIEVAHSSDVITTEANFENQVSIVSKPDWVEIGFTSETASFQQLPKELKEGIIFTISLRFRTPRIESDTVYLFRSWLNMDLAFRITDGNGTVHLIGNIFYPSTLSFDSASRSYTVCCNSYTIIAKALESILWLLQ